MLPVHNMPGLGIWQGCEYVTRDARVKLKMLE